MFNNRMKTVLAILLIFAGVFSVYAGGKKEVPADEPAVEATAAAENTEAAGTAIDINERSACR